MEPSFSSLKYKGSIPEAILEAKKQRKLFVVYISGEDTESNNLESSTWTDLNVAESLSKYCILLHIPDGSTDAANFSAIYPQKSVPCITAIGYNGVQVWQSEGFVNAEVLASSLEKAWLSLHIQETTAAVLTAALASKKSEPSTSGASNISSSVQGSASSTAVPTPSMDIHVQSSGARPLSASEIIEDNNGHEDAVEEKTTELGDKTSSKSFGASKSGSVGDEDEKSTSSTDTTKGLLNPGMVDPDNPRADHMSTSAKDVCPPPRRNIDNHSDVPREGLQLTTNEANETIQHEKAERVDDRKVDGLDNCTSVNKLSDVHLNIRLPNGVSLQEKFSVTSTLRVVKDYVDRNQASGMGTYDLAIPYPRKVFSDQDLSKSLSELDLLNRQALILVPHQRATAYHRGEPSSSDQTNSTTNTDSSNGNGGGYFAYVKRILSYANPFSYLGGGANSSSSGQESQTSMWQYSPNPTLRNSFAGTERPHSAYSPNPSTSTGGNERKSRQPSTSHFGSNIHTLKHDEDDDRFSDKNAFWNGNSTQYGGDNDGK